MNPISKILYPLIDKGYIDSWSFFHALFASVIAFISHSLIWVLSFAIIWEAWEWFVEGLDPYKGKVNIWLKNMLLDIIVAIIFGGLVIL